MLEQLYLFIVSLIANTLSSLAGGGAGLLQLPALVFLGLPFAQALATHKIASVALGLGASIKHLRSGQFRLALVLLLTLASLPGVVLGAASILELPQAWALLALAVLTILLGCYSIAKPELGLSSRDVELDAALIAKAAVGLFVIGFLNGSLTSGTGLFVTLWLIHCFGFSYIQAVAYTLVFVGIAWNGTGALTLALLQTPRWDWLPALLIGSLLGGYLGAVWGTAKGSAWVKKAFELMTLASGFGLLYKALLD